MFRNGLTTWAWLAILGFPILGMILCWFVGWFYARRWSLQAVMATWTLAFAFPLSACYLASLWGGSEAPIDIIFGLSAGISGAIAIFVAKDFMLIDSSVEALRVEPNIVTVTAIVPFGSRAVGPLLRALSDSEPDVRIAVCDTLNQIGNKATRAIPALELALEDSHPTVQAAAADAIARIRNS